MWRKAGFIVNAADVEILHEVNVKGTSNKVTGEVSPSTHLLTSLLVFFPQLKHLEVERAEKWLKMVKKWDKYKNSDRVSSSQHIQRKNGGRPLDPKRQ